MLVIIKGRHKYKNYKALMKAALKVYFMGNKNVKRTRSHLLDDMLYKYFKTRDYELIEHFSTGWSSTQKGGVTTFDKTFSR